ncbi:MAG TPA: GNAT family N-acetyltransferase [Roseateles sp.]
MTPHPNASPSPGATPDELLPAWGRGWAASRGTAEPVPLGSGAWRIQVGLPGHRRRDLLPAWPIARLRDWADSITAPGAWIKALADPAELQLPTAWQIHATEYLMSTDLADPTLPALAPGYRAERAGRGAVLECRVLAADGQTAARAQLGLAGRYAVFDQVVTEPAHRRLGLGRQAMALLAEAARAQGADTGLLVATEDGRALYTALGWRVDSLMAAASVAEAG